MKKVKKVTFRRRHKGRIYGTLFDQKSTKRTTHTLISKECGFLTETQIKAARISLKRTLKKGFNTWIRTSPFWPRSKKPKEVRMGKGKGAKLRDWIAPIKRWRIIVELFNMRRKLGNKLLRQVQFRLPIKTKIINRARYLVKRRKSLGWLRTTKRNHRAWFSQEALYQL